MFLSQADIHVVHIDNQIKKITNCQNKMNNKKYHTVGIKGTTKNTIISE
jgi:hypothetical protein